MDKDIEMQLRTEAQFYQMAEEIEIGRVMEWWADRMARTPRPFEEKMALFWHGHFATSNDKVRDYRKYLRQLDFFRSNATGNFRDLLLGMARDPAMLVYLDNKDNRRGGPNENFARELLELYTLGVGHFDEKDVQELARAFTGWTFHGALTADEASGMGAPAMGREAMTGRMAGGGASEGQMEFVFVAARHDDGEKTLFGERGPWGGEEALDIILRQEAAAEFLAAKLYRFLVREDMSADVRSALAKWLRENEFEIKPVVRQLLLSKDFYSSATYGAQIKGPVDLLVSTYRRLGLDEAPTAPDFRTGTRILGQELFYPPNVAGWRGGRAWITPATLLHRGNLMHDLLFSDAARGSHRGMEAVAPGVEVAGLTPEERKEIIERFARQGDQLLIESRDRFEAETVLEDLAIARTAARKRVRETIIPTPRFGPDFEAVAFVREAGASTPGEAVDALLERFLSVAPTAESRKALAAGLEERLGGEGLEGDPEAVETALRHALYEILSSTAYQLM